jgi:SagB-type dehydrogenase family enzyme
MTVRATGRLDSGPERGTVKKQPTTLSIAEFYHENTRYSPENLSSNVPDPLQRPALFKEYLSEKSVDLKPFLKGVSGPTVAAQKSRGTLRSLSRILYHTGGITDIVQGRGGTVYFRAAPSAGALYPIEIYLITSGIEGLADGAHSYSVRDHALVPVWEGDFTREIEEFCFRHPAAGRAKMSLVLTGVFRRSAWRYRERAYRRILLDAGHVLGNAVAYAAAEGLGATPLGGFFDAAMGDLLFLDREEEAVLLIAPLIQKKELAGTPVTSLFAFPSVRNASPGQPAEKGLMQLLHSGSSIVPGARILERMPHEPMKCPVFAGKTARPQAISLAPGGAAPGSASSDALAPSIGPVIRRRRSARSFGKGPVALKWVAAILRSAYAPVRPYLSVSDSTLDDWMFIDPTMIATYLVATRVDGLPAGVYRMDGPGSSLHAIREGDFSSELWNLCLGQDLARDAAAAVIHMADLPACVERYGDRAYRYLHIDAGHLGQRINLAAIGRDVAVSGIGGFFDAEVNALLDLPERVTTLYITLLGQPAGNVID